MTEASQSYMIALGSNRRHPACGEPRAVIAAAIACLGALGTVAAQSAIVASAPLGPSRRRYANAAVLLHSDLAPLALLGALQRIERDFGRRRARRWGTRVIDLDIVLWSGGLFAAPGLSIPHPGLRERRFVLDPAAQIAPGWRDPMSGHSIRQLARRLSGPKPLDRGPSRS